MFRDLFWPHQFNPFLTFAVVFLAVLPVLLAYYHLGRVGLMVGTLAAMGTGFVMKLSTVLVMMGLARGACVHSHRTAGLFPALSCTHEDVQIYLHNGCTTRAAPGTPEAKRPSVMNVKGIARQLPNLLARTQLCDMVR